VPYAFLHGVQKKKVPLGFNVNTVLKQVELDTFRLLWLVLKYLKFIHPSRDGVSAHCCVVHLVVSKMANVQERPRCVGRFFETKSVTQT
jgi:hypothetical protein